MTDDRACAGRVPSAANLGAWIRLPGRAGGVSDPAGHVKRGVRASASVGHTFTVVVGCKVLQLSGARIALHIFHMFAVRRTCRCCNKRLERTGRTHKHTPDIYIDVDVSRKLGPDWCWSAPFTSARSSAQIQPTPITTNKHTTAQM